MFQVWSHSETFPKSFYLFIFTKIYFIIWLYFNNLFVYLRKWSISFFILIFKICPKFKGQCKSDADCCSGRCGLSYPDRDGMRFVCDIFVTGQTTNGACCPPLWKTRVIRIVNALLSWYELQERIQNQNKENLEQIISLNNLHFCKRNRLTVINLSDFYFIWIFQLYKYKVK
jgi:hypothetical protein